MAQQTINVGTAPNDGTGTPLRTAFQYTNSNFSELYTAVGPSGNNIVVPGSATITGDLTVKTNVLKVDTTNNRVGIVNASPAYPLDVIGNINTDSELYSQGGRLALYRTAGASYQDWASGQALIWRTVTSVGGAGASELMRLNSTGLGVGVASPAYKLDVNGVARVSATGGDGVFLSSASATDLYVVGVNYLNNNGTEVAYAPTRPSWKIEHKNSTDATAYVDIGFRAANAAASAFTSRFKIDGSGNVGIGVTPSAWESTFKAIQINNRGAYISATSNSFSTAPFVHVGNNGYYDSVNARWQYVTANTAAQYVQAASSHYWYTAASGAAGAAITDFATAKMTLDASGNLLVGTTAAAAGRLDVRRTTVGRGINYFSTASGDLAQVGLYIGKFDNDSTTSQKFIAFSINNDSAGSGQINANGANQAAFGSFSDSRLKENIVSLPSQLDNILSLRPVEFDYKDGSGHQIGFVAQEMQQVYSDAVGESDGFLTVTGWSKTEARLVSAIKELAAKVQALEAKLA